MPRLAYTSIVRAGRRAFARGWPSLALLAMAAWFLSPAVGTGYWAEDAYYSTMVVGGPIARGTSWLSDTADSVRHSMEVGRFYPITPIITAAAFGVFRTLTGYKAYIVGMTVIDVALFSALIRRLTGRRGFAWLSALVAIALFQFRLSVDPLLAYYGQIQWVTAALFVSLGALQRHLDRGGRISLLASAGAFWFCTLSYEATYALVPLPILLILAGRRPGDGLKRAVTLSLPYLSAVAFCGGMTFLLRRLYPTDNYVHHVDASAGMAAWSWGYQVSAAFPLSYYLADPLSLFEGHRGASSWLDWVLQPDVIAVAAASMLIADRAFRNGRRPDADEPFLRRWPTVLMLGVGLVGLTPILTSISSYHRAYLRPGVGWIGVLVEYFGMGLLISLGLWRLAGAGRSFHRGRCLAASALVASVAGLTYRANLEVAACFGAPLGSSRYRDFAAMHGLASQVHRENIESAIRAGGMDEIVDGSRIAMGHAYALWHDPAYGAFFYAKETGRKVEMFPPKRPTSLPPGAPLFRVLDQARDHDRGFVVVSPGTLSSDQKVTDLGGGRVYIRHPDLQPTGRPLGEAPGVIVTAAPSTGPGEAEFDESRRRGYRPGVDLPAIRVGPGWGIFALPGSIAEVDPDSIKIVDSPPLVASWLDALETSRRLAGGPTPLSKTR